MSATEATGTGMGAYYMDSSALVKLVVAEEESDALIRWIDDQSARVLSSDLARTELLRAARRMPSAIVLQTRAVLDSLTLLSLASSTFEAAGRLDPTAMRSLDAIHVAAAIELGDDLDGLVTYDDRMAEAAAAQGIRVLAPGRAGR